MPENPGAEKVRQFWNTGSGVGSTGIVAFGGGGALETDYRAYFELKHFRKMVPLNRQTRLLEIGCGTGRWALGLAPLVGRYEGVDFSELSLATAQYAVAARRLPNVQFHHCAAEEFKGTGPYDVVYFSAVTQYMSDEAVHRTLTNLCPCLTPTTVIVDRSTVRYKAREVREDEAVCRTIYRTPQEIADIYAAFGFRLCCQERSYRFLRGHASLKGLLFSKNTVPLYRAAIGLLRYTQPASLYLLLGVTLLADIVRPVPWDNGEGSHDFFLFRGETNSNSCDLGSVARQRGSETTGA
jgi:SAM-dependent methyltransferase